VVFSDVIAKPDATTSTASPGLALDARPPHVRAVGVITQGPIVDGDFGHKFFIDDGSGEITVFVNLGTNADVSHLAVGPRTGGSPATCEVASTRGWHHRRRCSFVFNRRGALALVVGRLPM
jgi:hypothetical protein